MKTENLERYLDSFGKQVIKDAKRNLKRAKGSTRLANTLKSNVVPYKDGFAIQFKMADYGAFVDKGVKGAGGTIKSGEHEGSWGGRRYYTTWQGRRKDSPFKFGSGKSSGSIYKGISDFIKKKGIKGRNQITGRFITNKSLTFAIVKVLWIKGIHGISFFQKSLYDNYFKGTFSEDLLKALKQDIIDNIKTVK
jgi:hypothetical protein